MQELELNAILSEEIDALEEPLANLYVNKQQDPKWFTRGLIHLQRTLQTCLYKDNLTWPVVGLSPKLTCWIWVTAPHLSIIKCFCTPVVGDERVLVLRCLDREDVSSRGKYDGQVVYNIYLFRFASVLLQGFYWLQIYLAIKEPLVLYSSVFFSGVA